MNWVQRWIDKKRLCLCFLINKERKVLLEKFIHFQRVIENLCVLIHCYRIIWREPAFSRNLFAYDLDVLMSKDSCGFYKKIKCGNTLFWLTSRILKIGKVSAIKIQAHKNFLAIGIAEKLNARFCPRQRSVESTEMSIIIVSHQREEIDIVFEHIELLFCELRAWNWVFVIWWYNQNWQFMMLVELLANMSHEMDGIFYERLWERVPELWDFFITGTV